MKLLLLLVLVSITLIACGSENYTNNGATQTIVSIGPSNTEILMELGLTDRIIAIDTISIDIPNVPSNLTLVDMWAVDAESLLVLQPDIIIATDMILAIGADPLALLSQSGIRVEYIRVGETISQVKEDILFIAELVGEIQAGEVIVANMNTEISRIQQIASGISNRRVVYFEIDAPPFMFSFGTDTFLNELLETIGAINLFADQSGWLSISDEQIFARDPDVILTNVDWMDDPVAEIISRPGWSGLTAVQENRIYVIEANASSRPSHNIINALQQMAMAVYPEYFS